MPKMTASAADARNNFSKIAKEVNRTGQPVTAFRNSRPWVVISPSSDAAPNEKTLQAIEEAEEMTADPGHEPYATFEGMMTALNKACDDA